jgi:hypothetical protein
LQRHRDIAGAPERSAGEAWEIITALVADTLERSDAIQRTVVEAALAHADGIGRMLIAGGHLETHPLVIVAGRLWLEIRTVSGDDALTLEENLGPVPGAADAEHFVVFLPSPAPLASFVKDVVEGDDHLSADEPTAANESRADGRTTALDETALARWAREKP